MENLAFIDVGGEDNALDGVGKEILEKLENNEYERDTEAFIPVPAGTAIGSFTLLRDLCLERGTLFEDTQFPVESIPLYFTRGEVVPIQWLRPHQIVERPQFINKEPLAADVRQGSLGDCWALAAASVLAEFGPLFYRVVPPDQGFRHGYAGIFRFHFWYYGRWTEVIIDDRLPCRESNRKLLYSRPPAENVFWAILLEKAYSKLYGGYTALVGGKVRDCLSDLTGGITEEWDLQMLSDEKKADLEKILLKVSANCVFGCETENENNELQSIGLVAHHAYAITEAQQFISATSQRQTIVLFIRNPWGRANWRGALSLNSPDWEMVPAGIKKYMEKKLDENSGGFWILLDDFIRLFSKIHLCFLEPHAISEVREMTDRSIRKLWDGVMFDGVWQRNETAWGSLQSAATNFTRNPQYFVQIGSQQPKSVLMIISLMQKYRREEGKSLMAIGFHVYRVTGQTFLYARDFPMNYCARTSVFSRARETSHHFTLETGNYVVIPSTFVRNDEGEFMLRIFSTENIEAYCSSPPVSCPERRYVFKPRDELRMWEYIYFEARAGNSGAKAPDEQFWQSFINRNLFGFKTSAVSLERNFRRMMLPQILDAQLPNKFFFFVLRLFEIELNDEAKERLKSRTRCTVYTKAGGISFLRAFDARSGQYWPEAGDIDLIQRL